MIDVPYVFFKINFVSYRRSHMLNVISNWLDSKTELKAERRSCDAELLEPDVIANLEYQIDAFMRANKRGRYVNLKSRPNCLYQVFIYLRRFCVFFFFYNIFFIILIAHCSLRRKSKKNIRIRLSFIYLTEW